ncbi:LysR family transcriptional regulator [Pigmentiphaga sp. H8]|uniref:LysR substrate-binding domain-containing protein n=1 Tax=Pigmentiphaga sp. H8 TaxID=2488560 RepID=UPI000F5A10A1|nr:LysR substrate-binding domain-containing protein [Pigmentiphaga sp. H8]AZG08026.1 LysR family transcriptional regulator [Pigmentiphaga sp. H8]
MRIHSPSMSELHAFVTAAQLGSFTKAAQTLCVTQGAISRAIARLEDHFGQPLMARSAHGLALTEAGRRLADAAGPLQAIEAISAELRAAARRHQLSLSVVPTLASVWLVPRLPDFHRRHPQVELSFSAYRRDEDFSGAMPDAAILSGVPEQWPQWQCDYVIGKDIVVICHPDRLAARRAAGRWKHPAELLDEPLLYHTNAKGNWPHWFQAVGVEAAPRLANGFDQVSILVRAVMADMGLAVLQRCLVRDEVESARVAVPFDVPVELPRGYVLCTPVQRRDHPALIAFRAWLLETASKEPA